MREHLKPQEINKLNKYKIVSVLLSQVPKYTVHMDKHSRLYETSSHYTTSDSA